MPRFGIEHGVRSIRASPLYKPYKTAILHVAGHADEPAGMLEEATVIGRGKLFDALNNSPKCLQVLGAYALPEISDIQPRNQTRNRKWRGIMTVVGTVMGDLGYVPYSHHAWSRNKT